MATGDITAAQVLALADFNSNTDHVDGWVLKLTIEGRGGETLTDLEFDMDQSGTYDNNLDDVDNAAVVVSLTSESYTGTTLGTTSRTVYGTRVLRQIYPNNANLELANASGDLVVYIALSDYVFTDDTSLTVAVAENFCRRATGSVGLNNSVASLAVTNSSTIAYSDCPPVANWNIPSVLRYWDPSAEDFTVSICAAHGFPKSGEQVAAVVFTITDGTNTASKTVTASTLSELYTRETTNGTRVIEYAATFTSSDVTGFTQGACEIRCQVYPHIGDAAAVLDSGTTRGAGPNGLQPFEVFVDDGKALNPPVYAYLTPGTTGASPAVSETRGDVVGVSTAAYGTISAAVAAISAYNNTNYSANVGNNPSNGVIVIGDITDGPDVIFATVFWGSPSGTHNAWCTVEPENPGGVVINNGSGNGGNNHRTPSFRIKGLTVSQTVSRVNFNGRGGTSLNIWLDGVTFTDGNDYNNHIDNFADIYLTDCDFTGASLTQDASGADTKLIRACESNVGAAIGVGGPAIGVQTTLATANKTGPDNLIVGFCKILDRESTSGGAVILNGSVQNYALLQVVGEKTTSTTPAAFFLAADSNTSVCKNVIIHASTVVGGRSNILYNDAGNAAKTLCFFNGNIVEAINFKGDVFGTNATYIGNQNIQYGVGFKNNLSLDGYSSSSFAPEYIGLNSYHGEAVAATTTFTDDKSGVSGAGSGDYTLATVGEADITVVDGIKPFSFDLAGDARGVNYAGAYGGGAVSGGAKHQRINLALGLGL